jgi:hypothetical protein
MIVFGSDLMKKTRSRLADILMASGFRAVLACVFLELALHDVHVSQFLQNDILRGLFLFF